MLAACYLHDLVNVPKDDPRRACASRLSAELARERLDGLGAVGLARMFYIAGRMGSALAHASDPLAQDRPLDDRAYSLDHIEAKLARLPAMMQTEAGRALGEARLATLTEFRRAFAAEWSGAPHVDI